jgi:glutamine amidotransferase
MKIVVVDYGMGNLQSVARKIKKLGVNVEVSADAQVIAEADKLILPGVGHFSKAMENLASLNLIATLEKAVIEQKKPILGICLGMQLMARFSEEGNVNGLNWFDARVRRFEAKDTLKFKIPHIGWNQVKGLKASKLLHEIADDSEFYFVHSYHFELNHQQDGLCETTYEYPFISAIEKENMYGVQFHPEKSHDVGMHMLRNFVELC